MDLNHSKRLYFLDGIRGCAALLVLAYHTFCSFPISKNTVDLFFMTFNGKIAVLIFFIISGFSLSINFLNYGDKNILIRIATGRYFRLVIPILAIAVISYGMIWLKIIQPVKLRPSQFQFLIIDFPTIWKTIQYSLNSVLNPAYAQSLIPPVWTISYEFMGSLLVIFIIFLFHKLKFRFLIYTSLLIITVYYYKSSFYAAFILGLLFAEIYASNFLVKYQKFLTYLTTILFIPAVIFYLKLPINKLSLYLFSSSILVFCLIFNPKFRQILSSKICMFLGKISFPLYLIHVEILYSFNLWSYKFLKVKMDGIFSFKKLIIDIISLLICISVARYLVIFDQLGIRIGKMIGNFVIQVINFSKKSYQTWRSEVIAQKLNN